MRKRPQEADLDACGALAGSPRALESRPSKRAAAGHSVRENARQRPDTRDEMGGNCPGGGAGIQCWEASMAGPEDDRNDPDNPDNPEDVDLGPETCVNGGL